MLNKQEIYYILHVAYFMLQYMQIYTYCILHVAFQVRYVLAGHRLETKNLESSGEVGESQGD